MTDERNTQLTLIETQPDWRIDERTREIGREGIRKARKAMQLALRDHHRDAA